MISCAARKTDNMQNTVQTWPKALKKALSNSVLSLSKLVVMQLQPLAKVKEKARAVAVVLPLDSFRT